MKTYKQMYDEAAKAKAVKSLKPRYHDWKSDGNVLIGAFISLSAVDGALGGKSYNQYIFDTDEGHVKFSLGGAADNEVAAIFSPGVVYHIEYQGKEEIAGGRQVNNFIISEVGTADFVAPPEPKARKSGKAVDQE